MKIQVSEATPIQIDYLVAKIQGRNIVHDPMGLGRNSFFIWEDKDTGHKRTCYWKIGGGFSPTSKPEQGQPLMESHRIELVDNAEAGDRDSWAAYIRLTKTQAFGPLQLIAGLRCIVMSKFGTEVEVPDGLA